MKKIPRNLTGQALIKKLKKLGYVPTRQSGSHIRVTTEENGTHHLTIPNHSPIKVGTLSNILKDIASHFKITKDELVEKIF
jgi:predicted RNA binding protein YcfA (HicA-like mRNA interferase family)